ncbi:hypothetical protein JI750_10575 [Flavobacterium sp. GN10]|uniref:Zinc-ribbon 15 domain-containing protein n=1 Tax=Flavobacterium tagetis TaxID=2801336 RepID=A0ABS1KDD0_9FLAO|nr:hypothetical protein [Flavobacterium tagetis]MBL0737333.1 hypothetical protein [Flavobacterium tagetis]
MLFLIGTNDSNVKNGLLSGKKCPNCESFDTLHFSIFRKYVYITLIPLFPVGKTVNIHCDQCDHYFDYEQLSEDIQEKLRNEKLQSSVWMFSGSIIIALYLIYSLNNYWQEKDETSLLINTPLKGDVYNLKFSNGYYSTLKIDKITKDSVYTTHNDYDAYLPYEADDLDKAENYSDRKVNYSRKGLLELYKNDEIIKIRRSRQLENQDQNYKIPL